MLKFFKYGWLRHSTVFLFLTIIFTGNISAQTISTDSLLTVADLPNIIQYALRRQPAVQQALIDEQTTALEVKSRLSEWYPQLNFNYNLQHNFQVQTSVIGGNPVRLGVDNTSSFQFAASQAIFNRDVLLAKRSGADARLLSRQFTTRTRIDLVAEVSKAFYDVLATAEQVKVNEENIVRLERSLKDARARYDAGIVDKTDYKRATIALNTAKAGKAAIRQSLTAKTVYLKSLINYPENFDLAISYDSTTLEREINLDTLAMPDYTNRIEYTILETQRRLREANLAYNKWSYIPTVSAFGGYNLNFLDNNFSKLYNQSFPNSFAGLTLAFPIFQGGKRKYEIAEAKWQLKYTDLELVKLRNAITTEYRSAMAFYIASLEAYYTLKENIQLAQEVYDVINLQYKSGIKTYLEVILAETDLRTARISYFNALYTVLSSKIDVLRSKGDIKF